MTKSGMESGRIIRAIVMVLQAGLAVTGMRDSGVRERDVAMEPWITRMARIGGNLSGRQ